MRAHITHQLLHCKLATLHVGYNSGLPLAGIAAEDQSSDAMAHDCKGLVLTKRMGDRSLASAPASAAISSSWSIFLEGKSAALRVYCSE